MEEIEWDKNLENLFNKETIDLLHYGPPEVLLDVIMKLPKDIFKNMNKKALLTILSRLKLEYIFQLVDVNKYFSDIINLNFIPYKYKEDGILYIGKLTVVYRLLDQSKKSFALKQITKSPNNINFVKEEIKIHLELDHPNIIKIIEYTEIEDYIYLVMDLCGENLYTHLKKATKLQENEILEIFKQIMNAIKYLHDRGICHRDIKMENIVRCENNWKLIDFGFATKEKYVNIIVGTLDYVSPEGVDILKAPNQKCSPMDIWALGILLYELLYGASPFVRKTKSLTFQAIKSEEPDFSKRKINSNLKELINLMLTKNPKNRINIDNLLEKINSIK